jgi:hypothetical protein
MVMFLALACVQDPGVAPPGEPAGDTPVVDEPEEPPAPDTAGPDLLGVTGALARASLDLRGIRPSLAELAAVEADPAAYDALVASYLQDERFGERVRDLFSEIYLTRQDAYYVYAAEFGLTDQAAFVASVGEEPLRILSTIAVEDLPYSDIVTADWTMADPVLGTAFPVDYPDGGEGWQKVRYTDGRPHAGVLSTNGMWWRYMTNASNLNRGRANAVSRILLCNDYLSRPIEFDRNVNLLDSDALEDALQNNPGCVACHNTLDPLASYFFGFYAFDYASKLDITYYHPEREQYWRDTNEVAPGYYGEPGYTLTDLGEQIAADPRLPECVTEQVYELLLQRDSTLDDTAALSAHREDLLAGGLTLRALFGSVMRADAYREGRGADGTFQAKMLSVDQLGTVLEDLTGFRFTYQGYDLLGSDSYGVRTLAGGVDGVYATRPATQPTATSVLVTARVAQAAAWHVATTDHAAPDTARLFTLVNFSETPQSDRDVMEAQLQLLHLRLYGLHVAADGPEVEANLALWQDLYAIEGDKLAAWAGVLSVLLRDPQFLFY